LQDLPAWDLPDYNFPEQDLTARNTNFQGEQAQGTGEQNITNQGTASSTHKPNIMEYVIKRHEKISNQIKSSKLT
jgi:hypothetical protein